MNNKNLLLDGNYADQIKPKTGCCDHCGAKFEFRKNKRFCGKTCTKATSRGLEKVSNPSPGKSEIRRYTTVNDIAKRCAERYYTLPPNKREEYLLYVIGCSFQSSETRDALTSPHLVKPELRTRASLFWNKDPQNNLTIAEIANRYCKLHLNSTIQDIVKKKKYIEVRGVEMSEIDHRYNFKGAQSAKSCEKEVNERMKDRPEWVRECVNNIFNHATSEVPGNEDDQAEFNENVGLLFLEMLEDEETMDQVHHAIWLEKEERRFAREMETILSASKKCGLK